MKELYYETKDYLAFIKDGVMPVLIINIFMFGLAFGVAMHIPILGFALCVLWACVIMLDGKHVPVKQNVIKTRNIK